MSQTIHATDEIAKLCDRLQVKRDKLRDQLLEVEKEFEAALLTLKLMGGTTTGMSNINLSGMTHLEALVAIAKANDNVLVVRMARRIMTRAGMFTNPKNASSILFTAISRSGKFRPISKGKYELVEQDKPAMKLVMHLGEPIAKTPA